MYLICRGRNCPHPTLHPARDQMEISPIQAIYCMEISWTEHKLALSS